MFSKDKCKKGNSKAFTLVEILAVIVVIAILIIVAIPIVGNIISNTKRNAYYASVSLIVDTIKKYEILENNESCIYMYDKSYNADEALTNNNVKKETYEDIDKLYVLAHKENNNTVYSVFSTYNVDKDKDDPRTIDVRDFSKTKSGDKSTWLKDIDDENSYTFYSQELYMKLDQASSESLLDYNLCAFGTN